MCSSSGKKRPSSWSDLPQELVERIAKCIDIEIDFLHFRAVCSSWHTSTKTTTFEKFPSMPLKLPFPFDASETLHNINDGVYFSLAETTVYHVQLPDSEKPKSWVVKIEKLADGKLRLINPLSDHQIKILLETPMPKELNTLGFRVIEICKAYSLQYINPKKPKHNNWKKYAKKVVLSRGEKDDEYAVMAIDENNQLWHIKSGDEKWTVVHTRYGDIGKFLDVVNYKGQFYGIGRNGRTCVFDSMFNQTEIGASFHTASKRHLVDLDAGELFLVEEVTDEDKRQCTCYEPEGCMCNLPSTRLKYTAEEIIISKLGKRYREWDKMEEVKDWIIFAGDDCTFCVSAKEFEGCKGTRVFYTDKYFSFQTEEEKKVVDDYYDDCFHETCVENDDSDYDDGNGGWGNYCDCCFSSDDDDIKYKDNFVPRDDVKVKFRELHGHNTGVCEYGTGKIGSLLKFPEFADVFWPPPSWISSN